MELVKPGRYTAVPIDWAYTRVGEKQTPAVKILFEFEEEPGKKRQLTYTGWLTPAGKEYALKTLFTCGFQDDDLHRFAEGAPSGALKTDQPVVINVNHDTRDGKTHADVAGVFPAGGQRFRELAAKPGLKTDIDSLNLKGDILAAKQSLGKPRTPAANQGQPLPGGATESDLPW